MAEFIDRSDEAKKRLSEAIEAALEAIGNQAVSHAKSIVTRESRVDTGAMRSSISHNVDMSENAVYVGTNMEYAIYHELGTGIYISGGRQSPWAYQDSKGKWHRTRGIKPIHFIKNAVQDHQKEYMQIAAAIMQSKMQ